jgi:hypothetical protein
MTAISPAIMLQVRGHDNVMEPYRPLTVDFDARIERRQVLGAWSTSTAEQPSERETPGQRLCTSIGTAQAQVHELSVVTFNVTQHPVRRSERVGSESTAVMGRLLRGRSFSG